ncbi:PTS sugar transporter subunit IIA [Exiguobacterium sp. s22]|uniref:PTS sugar transporter subunit IIA n=1 Tax=Exiguobacterium sp. s22 TaxID=2751272 RepID=UPI001BEA61A7|nr:PTS sugar transporter subunit IIA [Exiguobacterium sp. s22]
MRFDETLILQEIVADRFEDVLDKMANHLYELGIVKESYIEAVLEREKTYATGLPTNSYSVAIPHTDSEHVNEKAISLAILKNPVPFGIMGEANAQTPVKLVFMLAMDEKESQLTLLQNLMQIFQNENTLEALATETSKSTIRQILHDQLLGVEQGGNSK